MSNYTPYTIKEYTLKKVHTGQNKTFEACLAENEAQLFQFIDCYIAKCHNVPNVLLKDDLGIKFGLWQLAHDKEMDVYRKEGLWKMFKLSAQAITGHGYAALGTLGEIIYDTIKHEQELKENNPGDFVILARHLQVEFEDNILGIDLNSGTNGAQYLPRLNQPRLANLYQGPKSRYV